MEGFIRFSCAAGIYVYTLSAILLFSLFHPLTASAQDNSIKFSNISLKDGLSQSSVNGIVQDNRGFIWLATQDGLNRYDGYSFSIFKNAPSDSTSISDNFIRVIFKDKKGNIWCGTDNGINRFNSRSEKFNRYSIRSSSPSITAISQDREGTMWFGTAKGELLYLKENSNVLQSYRNDLLAAVSAGSQINNLYCDESGTLWVGSNDKGLAAVDFKSGHIRHFHSGNGLRDNKVWTLSAGVGKTLWIGCNTGLQKINTSTYAITSYSLPGNEQLSVRSIYQDPEDNLWIASGENGVYKIDGRTKALNHFFHQPFISTSLINNTAFCVFRDHSGTIWIGTNKGVSKFDAQKQNFRHYRNIPFTPNTLVNDVLWSVCEDEKQSLWIGHDLGLMKFDREQGKVTAYNPALEKRNSKFVNKIFAIEPDGPGKLWLGTDGGLYSFNTATGAFSLWEQKGTATEGALKEKRVYSILLDRSGTLWAGTREGLYVIDRKGGKTWEFYQGDKGGLSNNIIRCIFEDRKGNIWIGTGGGGLQQVTVQWIDNSPQLSFKTYNDKNSGLTNNTILSMWEDKAGVLWLGTYGGGVIAFNPAGGTATSYLEKDGLSNDVVYGIYGDEEENIWMSTNKGISRYNPFTRKFNNYYENDGLQSNEFNIGAHFKSRSGEMFFGGINGLTAFFPRKITHNVIPPKVVLTDFRIFNKKVAIGGKSPLKESITETESIVLHHKDDVITFEFAALHFSSSGKNRYAYMMQGFDENWNVVDARTVSYTNLDPGDYIFKVKAANSDGVWNNSPLELKITIPPPVWQRWWFRIALAGLLVALIYGLFRYRLSAIHSQKRELARLVDERTQKVLEQKEKIEHQKQQLEIEKEKVEKLLLNILPQETVEELKTKGKASARHYRMATVMFTDFKNFTRIASSIRPKDLVDELDKYFIKFDEICEKYGIEKIKTIGDSYMCAAGIPIRNKSNPMDMVLAALEIQRYMEDLKREKEARGEKYWELRIGIHTGELIAGVIGIKRFAYDIWGDTVNVASRLESKGEVGKVNISGATYSYIKDLFECTYRGRIHAKNKGEIDMYFVESIRPELSLDGKGIEPNEMFESHMATNLFYKINYKKAEQFILKKLEMELPEDLFYHGLHHTIDVRDAAERIGSAEGIEGEDLMVLKTAAMYHDAGFVKEYYKNEPIGVEMAREILPDFGYSPQQIQQVEELIMATQIPHNASSLMEMILCDADLDYLGRDDFHTIADTLRQELMARGIVKSRRDWDALQISFLEKHQYFTETARKLRDPVKQKHLEEVKKRYAENRYDDEVQAG